MLYYFVRGSLEAISVCFISCGSEIRSISVLVFGPQTPFLRDYFEVVRYGCFSSMVLDRVSPFVTGKRLKLMEKSLCLVYWSLFLFTRRKT